MSHALRLSARLLLATALALALLAAGCTSRSGDDVEPAAGDEPEPDDGPGTSGGDLFTDLSGSTGTGGVEPVPEVPLPPAPQQPTVSADLCGDRDGLLDLGLGVGRLRVEACV